MAKEPAGDAGKRGVTRREALVAGLGTGAGAWALMSGTASAEAASATTFDPTGRQLVTANNVQDALEQVDDRLLGTVGGPDVFNVRDYGAKGDGVTNDSPAIIEALIQDKSSSNPLEWVPRFDQTIGGVLYFPPGVYLLHGIMYLWLNRLQIVGAGAGATTLLFKQTGYDGPPDYAPKIWFNDPRPGIRVHDVSVRDLTMRSDLVLTANSPRDSGESLMLMSEADRVRVSGVEVVQAAAFGISIVEATDALVDNCHVHDIHVDGIHFTSVTRGVIHGCRVDHTGDDGIAVSGGEPTDFESLLSYQAVVSSNVVSRSGSRGIAVFGADGVVISDNTVQGTHQAGIGVIPFSEQGNTRNVVIRGNHVDGAGLYGEDTDVLWGAGTPYGIAVWNADTNTPNHTIDSVLVEGNLVNDCRNGYVAVERASDVKVSGNLLYGPITTQQPAPGSHQRVGSGGGGVMNPPPPPYSGGSTPVFPAVRARRSKRVRIDNNLVRPAANERAFLVEGPTVAEVVRSRVTDNSIDRGTSPPLGAGGSGEMAFTPAGVVVYQGGNDVNGLAIPPTSTPA
jgi:hypothetical protein